VVENEPKLPAPVTSGSEMSYEQVSVTPPDALMEQWKRVFVNGDWIFSGDCPRCGHRWEKAITEEVMVMAFEADVPAAKDKGVHVVICNCTHAHPGRPDDAPSGCGAYWGILVRRSGPPKGLRSER
jgi:hypothetical protein